MRTFRYFRNIDGNRVPCVMELDDDLLLVREYQDVTAVNHVHSGRRMDRDEEPGRAASLLVARWVTEVIAVNPIPGTDELREDYFNDLRKLRDLHTKGNTECPPCEIGKLTIRYREKLEKMNLIPTGS